MNAIKRHISIFTALICALIPLGACNFTPGATRAEAAEAKPRTQEKFGDLLDVRTPRDLADQRKDYSGYRVSFNRDNHTPNWVAWELTAEETEGEVPRYNKFWTDDDIRGCPSTRDYTRSGYDRGHICPAGDNKISEQMMIDCFSLANICPQAHKLNAGAWKTLETKERLWAQRDGHLVIVAGPIYQASDRTRIGETGVRVPSAFFKVIIEPYAAEPAGIGFIYPNMTAPGDMYNYAMTIDEVERITGLDFFHQLPDQLENQIESRTPRQWKK